MVKVKGISVNITEGLKDLLLQNPPKKVKKAVIDRKRNDNGDLVQKVDDEGNPLFVDATVSTHEKVYFDALGNYYLSAFRTKEDENGKEVIVTNPAVKTDSDCVLYGKGVISHRNKIPGSELWDNGSDSMMPHAETICKGNPLTKIVLVLTRDEVLAVDLKPTGDGFVAKAANLSDAEKQVFANEVFGKDFMEQFRAFKESKQNEED